MGAVSEENLSMIVKLLTDRIDGVDKSAQTRHLETMEALSTLAEAVKAVTTEMSKVKEEAISAKAEVEALKARVAELEESKEARFAQRHPILMIVIGFVASVVGMATIAKFFPSLARLLGNI